MVVPSTDPTLIGCICVDNLKGVPGLFYEFLDSSSAVFI